MISQMRETFTITQSLFLGMREYFNLKFLPSVLLPAFGFFFGVGSEKILLGLLVLVVMDFLTGVFAAKKTGEPIRSRGAIKSAYKVAIYGLLVSAGHITETIIPLASFIEETITAFLALTELISILENTGKMGFAVPKRLLNQIHKWRDDGIEVIDDRRMGLDTRREGEDVTPKV